MFSTFALLHPQDSSSNFESILHMGRVYLPLWFSHSKLLISGLFTDLVTDLGAAREDATAPTLMLVQLGEHPLTCLLHTHFPQHFSSSF